MANLLSNAVHHGRPGTPVRVALRGDSASVLVSVQNQGPVIPPEHLASIFEPMQQLDPQASHRRRSVGLGLYIVDNIIAAHGGDIVVHSTIVDGTTFTVRLPRSGAVR